MYAVKPKIATFVLTILVGGAVGYGQTRVISVTPSNYYNVTSDDMARLRQLVGGVGWEFEPTAVTEQGLRAVNIDRVRLINIEPLDGTFDANDNYLLGSSVARLDSQLATCRNIGAIPIIVIGVGMPAALVVASSDGHTHGPNNWTRYRNYCHAVFEHVLIDQGFTTACFEVGNEADTGNVITEAPPQPGMGTAAAYNAYFKMYTNISRAATDFQTAHPGYTVRLGGPAFTWAYSFTYRPAGYNWTQKFFQDCHDNASLKLDFATFHFYGNISAISGGNSGYNYPTFDSMLTSTRQWRDQYKPGVPIQFHEWGPSYRTTNDPDAMVNTNHYGAAWSANFLAHLLTGGVERAIYLVTTDLRRLVNGSYVNVWGWPSFFTNSNGDISGNYPKPVYNLFAMVAKMAPKRIAATGPTDPNGFLGCLVSQADPVATSPRMTFLVWNNGYKYYESGIGTEHGSDQTVAIQIASAPDYFPGFVQINRYEISETVSNVKYLYDTGQTLDSRCGLQRVDSGVLPVNADVLTYSYTQPKSSVCLIEVVPAFGALETRFFDDFQDGDYANGVAWTPDNAGDWSVIPEAGNETNLVLQKVPSSGGDKIWASFPDYRYDPATGNPNGPDWRFSFRYSPGYNTGTNNGYVDCGLGTDSLWQKYGLRSSDANGFAGYKFVWLLNAGFGASWCSGHANEGTGIHWYTLTLEWTGSTGALTARWVDTETQETLTNTCTVSASDLNRLTLRGVCWAPKNYIFDDVRLETYEHPTVTVQGRAVLRGYIGDNTTVGLKVQLRSLSGGPDITQTLLLEADGRFHLDNVRTGQYDVSVRGDTWLAAVKHGVMITAESTDLGTFELQGADNNGDNVVTFEDFSMLQNGFGQSGRVAGMEALSLAAANGGCGLLAIVLMVSAAIAWTIGFKNER